MRAQLLAMQSHPFLKGPNQGRMLKAKGLLQHSLASKAHGMWLARIYAHKQRLRRPGWHTARPLDAGSPKSFSPTHQPLTTQESTTFIMFSPAPPGVTCHYQVT